MSYEKPSLEVQHTFYRACLTADVKTVKLLLEQGVSANLLMDNKKAGHSSYPSITPIIAVAKGGELRKDREQDLEDRKAIIKMLSDHNANMNYVANSTKTFIFNGPATAVDFCRRNEQLRNVLSQEYKIKSAAEVDERLYKASKKQFDTACEAAQTPSVKEIAQTADKLIDEALYALDDEKFREKTPIASFIFGLKSLVPTVNAKLDTFIASLHLVRDRRIASVDRIPTTYYKLLAKINQHRSKLNLINGDFGDKLAAAIDNVIFYNKIQPQPKLEKKSEIILLKSKQKVIPIEPEPEITLTLPPIAAQRGI